MKKILLSLVLLVVGFSVFAEICTLEIIEDGKLYYVYYNNEEVRPNYYSRYDILDYPVPKIYTEDTEYILLGEEKYTATNMDHISSRLLLKYKYICIELEEYDGFTAEYFLIGKTKDKLKAIRRTWKSRN